MLAGILAGCGLLDPAAALAQRGGGRHGGGDSSGGGKKEQPAVVQPPVTKNPITPHGGLCLATKTNYYEIVFFPFEIRVYLYNDKLQPLTAQALHAQISPQVSEGTNPKIPLIYVSPAGNNQDYVAVRYDLQRLPDNTPILVEFTDLPDRNFPTATFTPIFTQESLRPYVAHVSLSEADREGVARQQVCPVTGAPLAGSGTLVKVLIDQYPLYLSSEKCIETVRGEPQRFLPQPPGTPAAQLSAARGPAQPPVQAPMQSPVQATAAQFPVGQPSAPVSRLPPLYGEVPPNQYPASAPFTRLPPLPPDQTQPSSGAANR